MSKEKRISLPKRLQRPKKSQRISRSTRLNDGPARLTKMKLFSGHLKDGQPIFLGWLDDSLLSWDMVSLKERYGHCKITSGSDGTLAHLIDQVLDCEPVYSNGCKLPHEMMSDFTLPVFFNGGVGAYQLWLGSRSDDLVTGLHREVLTSVLAQVIGKKRLFLYSPDQVELVYGRKAYRSYQQCWVDPTNPDLKRFPKFSHARQLVVDLAPGEILLIPAGWFHCAYAVDDVFSVSTTLLPEILEQGRSKI